MHAFLLVGAGDPQYAVDNLAQKLQAQILEFPLSKIEDVRSLNDLVRLHFEKPTLIVSKNIDSATEETLNAFLKNLEEPQNNVYFLLTSPSVKKVLPTIASRCQVIKITNDKQTASSSRQMTNNEEAEKFLNLEQIVKINYVEKIKDRGEATKFVENLIYFLHEKFHLEGRIDTSPRDILAKNTETAIETLKRLKANGNIGLQLTNLAISLE